MIRMILGLLLLALPAQAADVWTSWPHTTGMPNFSTAYGWRELVAVNNLGIVRGAGNSTVPVAGRGTVTDPPPQQWCNDVVAQLRLLSPRPTLVVYDWEDLLQNTNAEEQIIVTKFSAALACFRAAATTNEFQWGFYAYVPNVSRPSVVDLWSTGANWATLATDNATLKPLLDLVDFVSMPFYHHAGYSLTQMERIHRGHVLLARAMTRASRNQPIYCWTYHRDTAEGLLPVAQYLSSVRLAHELCDGEWKFDWTFGRTWATESALGWWQEIQARAAASRSWSKLK